MERKQATTGAILLMGAVAVAVVALVLTGTLGGGPSSMSDRVDAIASDLRCPVCANLSVADSPSLIAREMRTTIAEQLRAGATPDEVKSYFVRRYGRWIVLSPDTSGLGLVAWIFPAVALVVGAGLLTTRLRRGTASDPEPVSAEDHERIERELASFEEPE
jgi:cytochrome c-type biogenesis protein CcmH